MWRIEGTRSVGRKDAPGWSLKKNSVYGIRKGSEERIGGEMRVLIGLVWEATPPGLC
jgi:hypothetical protein